jgi:hypothetical protein
MRLVGLRRQLTAVIDIERNVVVDGRHGALQTVHTGLKATPLYPVRPETRERLDLATKYQLLQTAVSGVVGGDVRNGDTLTAGDGRSYAVRAVENWPQADSQYLMLYVEALP